jgi:hypothetical protein
MQSTGHTAQHASHAGKQGALLDATMADPTGEEGSQALYSMAVVHRGRNHQGLVGPADYET